MDHARGLNNKCICETLERLYMADMSINVGQKIKKLREMLGESQVVFGERFKVEQATVSRWENGGPVQRSLQEGLALLAGMTVAEFFHSESGPQLIPVVGDIEFLDKFDPDDINPPGSTVKHITLDLGSNEDQVGVRIHGNDLFPAYRPGDILIGKKLRGPALKDSIGKDCIVKTRDGEGFIRLVRRGSGLNLYSLRAHSLEHDDIDDVELEWAAPITFILRDDQA